MSRSPRDLLSAEDAAALRPAPRDLWVEPMLATLTDDRFSDAGWVFERKLDGVRALVTVEDGEAHLWSRNHRTMDASYPELIDALRRQPPSRWVADGEIVAFDGSQTSFAALQRRIHVTKPSDVARSGVTVSLYLFDLLVLDDVDLRDLPLRSRKRLLTETLSFEDPLRLSRHRNTDGLGYYAEACASGWEGLIAKRADAPYRSGRSRDWLKLKCVHGQELVVGGFTEPRGARSGFGALLVGYHDDGGLRYAGKVGTGYDVATLRSLRARLDGLVRSDSPFDDLVRERGVTWVEPALVAQVGFSEWTRDGRLRHPRFEGLREDKDPADVVREQGSA